MRKLMGLTALMLALSVASIGGLTKAQAEQTSQVNTIAAKHCPGHVQGIKYYRSKTWAYQQELAEEPLKSSYNPHRAGCRYTKWVAHLWMKRAKLKRSEAEYIRVAGRDWYTATGLANQIYPGTRAWLLSCSHGEGGHGRWKWNTQGSGAGGWMQFMRGTFDGMVEPAWKDAEIRGFKLNEKYKNYYSPIGQAVAAAYTRYHSIALAHFHWSPAIDYLCE